MLAILGLSGEPLTSIEEKTAYHLRRGRIRLIIAKSSRNKWQKLEVMKPKARASSNPSNPKIGPTTASLTELPANKPVTF